MFSIEIFIALLVAVVVLMRFSRSLELPSAILLLVGGLGLSFIPGFKDARLAPVMFSHYFCRRRCLSRRFGLPGAIFAVTGNISVCSPSDW